MKHIALYGLLACTALQATADPQVKVIIRPDREVLPAGETGTAYIKVSLLPDEIPATADRPPLNIAFVLDRSGSMQGQKLEDAKLAVLEAVTRLDPRDVASLIIYDDQVETLVPARHFTSFLEFSRAVSGIQAGGYTAIYAGMNQGAAELRKSVDGNYVDRIILLSDGQANVGPSTAADFARLGRALAGENIAVSSIGLGSGFNEDLMTKLSEAAEGNAYFAESSRDLPRIFEQEIGAALNMVATGAEVQVELEPGCRPVRIIGREGRIDGQSVTFNIGQLYGGREKFALIEVQYDNTPSKAQRWAKARANYQSISGSSASNAGSVTIRFSENEKEVLASSDKDVAVDVMTNQIAAAQEEAILLADAGRRAEAAERLRQTAVSNVAYAAVSAAPPPPANAELEEAADEIRTDGMSNTRRKQLRFDSYETKTQQASASNPAQPLTPGD